MKITVEILPAVTDIVEWFGELVGELCCFFQKHLRNNTLLRNIVCVYPPEWPCLLAHICVLQILCPINFESSVLSTLNPLSYQLWIICPINFESSLLWTLNPLSYQHWIICPINFESSVLWTLNPWSYQLWILCPYQLWIVCPINFESSVLSTLNHLSYQLWILCPINFESSVLSALNPLSYELWIICPMNFESSARSTLNPLSYQLWILCPFNWILCLIKFESSILFLSTLNTPFYQLRIVCPINFESSVLSQTVMTMTVAVGFLFHGLTWRQCQLVVNKIWQCYPSIVVLIKLCFIIMTRESKLKYTSLVHNLPLLLNKIPDIVKEKLSTHSSQGCANYVKLYFFKLSNYMYKVNLLLCLQN